MKVNEVIIENGPHLFICSDKVLFCDLEIARLDETQVREFVAWLKENHPEIIRDIMCEECPEHKEQTEAHAYFHNLREHGS